MDIRALKIKLVIWDLDETFWKGTLSEGEICPIEKNLELVKYLTDRGIMNAISSKNDFAVAKAKLEELGVWDYFIFPHINWEPKGPQIRQILEEASLRAPNVIFIDDNLQNLSEAAYYNEGISVFTPDVIDSLFSVEGNPDTKHERLKQYKLLEQKHEDSVHYGSNEEFLFASNIHVQMKTDCLVHFDRLLDLINRSNQLNYTKVRLGEKEFTALLNDPSVRSGYVEVFDRYGQYGIVGFYAIRNGVAEHFLFSCRTIGMGIEQFVYAELGYPELHVVGAVRNDVTMDAAPKWIALGAAEEKTPSNREDRSVSKRRVLISGGCDLEQMAAYLDSTGCHIDYKFNIRAIRHDHTVYWVGGKEYSKSCIDEMIQELPFIGRATFEPTLYQGHYDVIVLSLLMDYTQAVYEKNTEPGVYVAYGDYCAPITKEHTEEIFNEKSRQYLLDNYHLIGRIPDDLFLNNLRFIRENLPSKTALILINGSEIPLEHPWEKDRYLEHIHYNSLVDEFISTAKNTYLLDMRKIVTDRAQIGDNIRHYDRKTYYAMANELEQMINGLFGKGILCSQEKGKGRLWKFRMKAQKLLELIQR